MKIMERVNDALVEMRSWFQLYQVWVALLFLGVVLTATGAFDTHNITSIFDRAMLFTVVMGIGGTLCVFVTGLLRGLFKISAYNNFGVAIALGIASIPFGALTGRVIHGDLLGYEPSLSLVARSSVHGAFVVSAILTIMYLVRFKDLPKSDAVETEDAFARPKLTPNYVQSEDHYLKIVDDQNVKFIRANIGEFANRLGAQGLRCHRSYWVALEAINHRRREGRQLLIVLNDGTEIPVGRSYEKQITSLLS